MAATPRVIDVTADASDPPWSVVVDVAKAIHAEEWVLVGGLMVEVHTRAAGLTRNRATTDMDLVVNVVAGRTSVQRVYGALVGIGFVLRVPNGSGPAHRLTRRDEEVVDVMAPDDLPAALRQRLLRRPAFAPPGAGRAVAQREPWTLVSGGERVEISVPSLMGAVVAKAVAFRVDPRDRDRHLEDCVALLAVATDDDLRGLHALARSERRCLRSVIDRLSDSGDPAWTDVDADMAGRGQDALRRLRIVSGL